MSSKPTRHMSPGSADAASATKVLHALEALQSREIAIIKISEPISSALAQDNTNIADHRNAVEGNSGNDNNNGNGIRTSDVSNSSLDAPTPASLEADLAHYKELFAKLRFSYVEQVTKEKFIRAIVGDPPLIVSPQDNAELEASNAEAKAALKALKTEVSRMVADLEIRGRALAARYQRVQLETATLRDLPDKIAGLEDHITELRTAQRLEPGARPELNMPLAKTAALVEERKARVHELDRQLEQLSALAPRKRKETERLQAELTPLETRRQNSTAAAREAHRRKEAALGGVEDDLEAKGRWYRAQEAVLKQMLDLQS
ncbi:putative 60s ribosomal protein l37 protein [Diplogelasinospora grovesii]|uniref:60s ribosomal protein l37 protein n=1 Tax=Diplogelasinospora grovesii TaxID=303347 RepID=A0AAN6NH09_9PEZI|nr:putative 60s ribosomal protein l37 protein [Diplogelasinospora grovesii]